MTKPQRRCPDCDTLVDEASVAIVNGRSVPLYPKTDPHERHGRWVNYREERWFCPRCRKEWIYGTAWREWCEVPSTSQLRYDPDRGMLVANQAIVGNR